MNHNCQHSENDYSYVIFSNYVKNHNFNKFRYLFLGLFKCLIYGLYLARSVFVYVFIFHDLFYLKSNSVNIVINFFYEKFCLNIQWTSPMLLIFDIALLIPTLHDTMQDEFHCFLFKPIFRHRNTQWKFNLMDHK